MTPRYTSTVKPAHAISSCAPWLRRVVLAAAAAALFLVFSAPAGAVAGRAAQEPAAAPEAGASQPAVHAPAVEGAAPPQGEAQTSPQGDAHAPPQADAHAPAQGDAHAPADGDAHSPAQGDADQADAHQEGGHGEEHAAESPWGIIGRIFNFAALAGILVYLLRSPAADYLRSRAVGIRSELREAADLRDSAARQLTEIDARMRALPDQIKALTARGAEEIAAEEARIRNAAEAERQRMLEQARREIDLQVRLAERMLRRRAGELAVEVATERVRRTITDADQARLVDRYLAQVQPGQTERTGGLPS